MVVVGLVEFYYGGFVDGFYFVSGGVIGSVFCVIGYGVFFVIGCV